MQAANWQPLVQEEQAQPAAASGVSADARRLGLTVRVREALYVCARGGTAREYQDAIRRAALAGVAVGTKYNHHSFMDLVEHLSVVCCRDLLANQLCQLLPGLGIPSDLALVWDGVSIGGAMWSRQETFCVLGVGFCDTAGRIHYRLVATPSENLQKAGPAQVDLVVASLQDHPAGLSRAVLRQRLSIVGGDGAIVGGGVDAKHSSTKAAELFWENIMGAAGGPPCTEWDLFHRVDAALSLVMRNHAAIAEVLDVGRSLGALFGTGDGRVLFRSTQKAIGSSQRVLPDQGGTRKIVAVAGSVDYIVTNLPALIASMHARLGLARSRKTAQSVGSLVDMGRRLSALNFVAFALAAADVLQRHIVPLALVAQRNDIGALSVWRRTASCQASLGEALATLSVIEDWWFVTALVGCMVSVADMARLWTALLISPLGRSFPRLVGATHHALWKQTYHRCSLHVDQAAAELDVRTLTLSPRCQCSSMRTRRSHGPRRALITLHGRRGPVAVRVPEWVAHSSLGAGFGVADVREGRGPRDVLPRYVRWAETAPPRELQGERRFCTAPAPCRCQVPPSLPNRLRALRQASRSCSAFLQSLRAALEDFSGARGASDHMLALGRDAALALNWGDLTSKPPTREQHLAFLRLARALKPALQRTLWPSTDVFPHVCCEWPAERGQNGWFQQFRELAQRLRRTARDPRCSWWRVEKWLVQPVIRTHVEASVGRLLAVAGAWQQPAARARVCQLIGEFVGAPSVSAGVAAAPTMSGGALPPFWASVAALAGLGYGARLPGARSLRSVYMFRGGVGSLASLTAPARLRGKVVTVIWAKRALDDVALEAALATLPDLSAPGADGDHCYHVVRLIHRVRLLRAVESCCERWGSIIHQLWDGQSVWHPRRIAGRLLMRDSGLGEISSESEGMVAEITDFLSKQGMDPFVQDRRLRDASPMDPPPAGLREVCRRALRESPYTQQLAADAARPCSLRLRPEAEEALAKARRAGGTADFEPLPLFQERVSALRRDRAMSVVNDARQDWLRGPDAADWREKRAAIFGTGEGPAIPAPPASDSAGEAGRGEGGAEGSAGDA